MILEFLDVAKGCLIAILPLLITFILFQVFSIKMSLEKFRGILVGILLTYVGVVFLIFGLEIGYVEIGKQIGLEISKLSYNWIIVPIGFILGFVITRVEPSVQVLTRDIEKETGGAIKKNVLLYTLAIGVALSLALALLKILLKISLWYIVVPGYIICIVLAFTSDERFTALAFDAGGVTTGVITTTFLLAMALGLAEGIPGANPATDGFGLIAIVAMTPIILVMLLGKIYGKKQKEGKIDVKK